MQGIIDWLKPSYQTNPTKFLIYRVFYNFMLFNPVWVIFIQRKFDLSLTQITLVDTAFWFTMALTEIPTGAAADTLGRRGSQLIGMVLATGSILLFAFAPSYPWLLIANSLWAFAFTFISGAELAFLYDSMQVIGRGEDYPKFRGTLSAVAMSTIAVSSALGGWIGEYNLRATFVGTAICMAFGTVFLALLKEPPREEDPGDQTPLTYRETLSISLTAIKAESELRYALLYISILPVMGAAIRITFIQPHALALGLPISALGILALGIRAFQILGASSVNLVIKVFGEWKWVVLSAVFTVAGLLALGSIVSLVGIILFAISGFAHAASAPLAEKMVLRHTPPKVRATILSIASFLYRLILAAAEPGIGFVGDRYGLPDAFFLMSVVFGIGLLFLLWGWHRARTKSRHSSSSLQSPGQ